MFKKSVSYLVLSSLLLVDAASCMESEDKGSSSPPRSPRVLRNPPEPSPASSSTSLSDPLIFDPQERLQAISRLPWDERNRPYAEFALKEDIPITLRREAFSSIRSTDSLDETTREELKNLRTTFLNAKGLPFKDRFAFLPYSDKKAPPVGTLLSLTRALESADDKSYSKSDIRRLTSFLMDCDPSESQEGIERCYFKQPTLFLDGAVYKEWLRTTLEMSDESKKTSILQKLREVMHSAKDVTKVANIAKFILKHSQNTEDKENALETFFNIITAQQNASHSGITRKQFFRQKQDIRDACNLLLPHAPKDKATLLRTLFDEMLQQLRTEISEIIAPQEKLQAISTLPWGERNRSYAELALAEDIPMALRREAFFSIHSTHILDEVTKRRLGNLKSTFLSDEELPLQKHLKILGANGVTPSITMLLSLTRALESANEKSCKEWWNISRLISFLISYTRTESQEGIETCFFKQPELFLDGSVWEKWLRTTLETSDESKRASILQKVREVMHSAEDVTKVAAATKFILQYSQDPGDKETALSAFFNVTTQQTASHSKTHRELFLERKLDISDACKTLLSHVSEEKATLLKTLSEEMRQQVDGEISAIIDPQERLEVISMLSHEERNCLYAKLALEEDTPMALRQDAFFSIYSMDSLDEVTRERLISLRIDFLNDEKLSLMKRLKFLPDPEEETPPVATLLSLMGALEAEDRDSSDSDDETGHRYTLYRFLVESPDPEVQQGLSPRVLALLLTQEDPSVNIRAREVAEQQLDQDNLDYTLDLFFNLEKKNLEQGLRHKIQERLKAKFNDSTDKEILLRLAPVFLRATDENLSQKAFNCLKQDLINNDDPEYVETIFYQIIKAVGVDHPWAQEVINIGIEIGIEASFFLKEVQAPSTIIPFSSSSMTAPSSSTLPSD